MSATTRHLATRFVWPIIAGLVLAALWVTLVDRDEMARDAPAALDLTPAQPALQDDEPEVELALPIETYEIFLSRDPFEPLIPTATGGGTDGGTTGGTGGTTTGGTGDGTTDGTTDGTDGTGGSDGTTGSTDGDACSGDGEVVCDGHVVSLVDVFVDEDGNVQAQVQVDSTIYTVGSGDTFATSFEVLSIDPPCVTLLFGDDAFTLCEGERVLK